MKRGRLTRPVKLLVGVGNFIGGRRPRWLEIPVFSRLLPARRGQRCAVDPHLRAERRPLARRRNAAALAVGARGRLETDPRAKIAVRLVKNSRVGIGRRKTAALFVHTDAGVQLGDRAAGGRTPSNDFAAVGVIWFDGFFGRKAGGGKIVRAAIKWPGEIPRDLRRLHKRKRLAGKIMVAMKGEAVFEFTEFFPGGRSLRRQRGKKLRAVRGDTVPGGFGKHQQPRPDGVVAKDVGLVGHAHVRPAAENAAERLAVAARQAARLPEEKPLHQCERVIPVEIAARRIHEG